MLPTYKVRERISEIQMGFNLAQIKEEKMMSVFKAMKLSESFLKEHGYPLGKDVYYRLKNNPAIGWRRLL